MNFDAVIAVLAIPCGLGFVWGGISHLRRRRRLGERGVTVEAVRTGQAMGKGKYSVQFRTLRGEEVTTWVEDAQERQLVIYDPEEPVKTTRDGPQIFHHVPAKSVSTFSSWPDRLFGPGTIAFGLVMVGFGWWALTVYLPGTSFAPAPAAPAVAVTVPIGPPYSLSAVDRTTATHVAGSFMIEQGFRRVLLTVQLTDVLQINRDGRRVGYLLLSEPGAGNASTLFVEPGLSSLLERFDLPSGGIADIDRRHVGGTALDVLPGDRYAAFRLLEYVMVVAADDATDTMAIVGAMLSASR